MKSDGQINFDAFYLKFYEVNGMDREEFKKHGFEEWEKMDAGMKESFEAGAAAVLAAHLKKDF